MTVCTRMCVCVCARVCVCVGKRDGKFIEYGSQVTHEANSVSAVRSYIVIHKHCAQVYSPSLAVCSKIEMPHRIIDVPGNYGKVRERD